MSPHVDERVDAVARQKIEELVDRMRRVPDREDACLHLGASPDVSGAQCLVRRPRETWCVAQAGA
jgi:hypothetical protein